MYGKMSAECLLYMCVA